MEGNVYINFNCVAKQEFATGVECLWMSAIILTGQ